MTTRLPYRQKKNIAVVVAVITVSLATMFLSYQGVKAAFTADQPADSAVGQTGTASGCGSGCAGCTLCAIGQAAAAETTNVFVLPDNAVTL